MAESIKDVWVTEWRAYKGYAEEAFRLYSQKANDLIRQLALAGIAVVWVFRETAGTGAVSLSPQLRWAAIAFVVTLTLDLLHYLVSIFGLSRCLDRIQREEQQAVEVGKAWPVDPVSPPPNLDDTTAKAFFTAKSSTLLIGSGILLFHLAFRV